MSIASWFCTTPNRNLLRRFQGSGRNAFGPGEKQYFSADDQPITKQDADRLSAASPGASIGSNRPLIDARHLQIAAV